MANAPPLLDGVLTFGPVAEKLGIKFWQLSRLYDTGKLPPATKLENMRLVHEFGLDGPNSGK